MLKLQDNEEVILERVYVVPLKKAWNSAYHKRTKRAIRILKEFASRHMKSDVENVYIDPVLNRIIWSRGNANPPRRIQVVMRKTSSGKVVIYDYQTYMRLSEEEKKKQEETKKEKQQKKRIDEKGDISKEEKVSGDKKDKNENLSEEKSKGKEHHQSDASSEIKEKGSKANKVSDEK